MTIKPSIMFALAMAMPAVIPADPVFAQGTSADDVRHAADVSISVTAAYDNDLSAAAAASLTSAFGPESIVRSRQLFGNAEYRWSGDSVQVRATGASMWTQEQQRGVFTIAGHTAAAGLTARLPRRSALMVNQTATYSPSQLYNLFPRAAAGPGEAPPAAPDYHATDSASYSYGTVATLTHGLTRRSSIGLTASRALATIDYPTATTAQTEQGSYSVSGRFSRVLGRNSTATGRYFYHAGNFGDATLAVASGLTSEHWLQTTEHGVDIGVAHTRPLSATHQISFDLSFGGTVVVPEESLSADGRTGPGIRVASASRLIGQAGAAYSFGRTWQTGVIYRRGIDYVPGLIEPVLTEGLSGRLAGSFTRRIEVAVALAYARGGAALQVSGPKFETYTSDATLRFTLGGGVSTYAQYLYYLTDFRQYAPLVPGLPRALERNGVRVGLTLFVPAVRR